MSTLVLFFSFTTLLSVILALIVIMPWLRQQSFNQDNRLLELNIDVFKQRLAELEQDYQDSMIDKHTYDGQKLALERQLLEISDNHQKNNFQPNWKSRLIFIVWIPVLATMAYLMVGDRTPVYKLWSAQDSVGKIADDLLTGKINAPPEWAIKDTPALISAMQTNVYHNATDSQRWFRLSEIFIALEAPESALEALSRAYRLNPDDEKVAITYAQTSFFSQGGSLDNNARQVLEHLLSKNSKHQGAQMLMAMGEMRAGNFVQAQSWVNVLKQEIQSKPGDHSKALQSLAELETNIAERQKQSEQAIDVAIKITPEILGRVKKGDNLFISVRNISGGMPIAAKKLSADSLDKNGMTVKISDNDSLMPNMTLSSSLQSGASLAVTARISSSGDAMPQSGDLTSNPVPLTNLSTQTEVLIGKVLP